MSRGVPLYVIGRQSLFGYDFKAETGTSMALAAFGTIAIWAFYQQASVGSENPETQGRWISSSFVLALMFSALLSSYYPWYYSWIPLFLCFAPNSAALGFTLITWPVYRSLIEQSGEDLFRFQSRIFLPFFALLVLSWILRKRSSRSAAKSSSCWRRRLRCARL